VRGRGNAEAASAIQPRPLTTTVTRLAVQELHAEGAAAQEAGRSPAAGPLGAQSGVAGGEPQGNQAMLQNRVNAFNSDRVAPDPV